MVPKSQNYFEYRIMFFQVCILEKKKIQCDIFPKWLYSSKKAQNCKNVDLKKIPCIFTWKYLLMLKMSHEKK